MGIRESIAENRYVGLGLAGGLVLIAAVILTTTFWPEKRADLSRAYYTDDDGKTWFADSALRVAPFERNGKTAVVAHVYNYAGGSKEFCAYMAKFTPEAKARLEAAITTAQKAGKPPQSVPLWGDRSFMRDGVVVKKPGDATWIPYAAPGANAIFTITSPDGSVVDQSFAE